jgi:GAF domain-containing protein
MILTFNTIPDSVLKKLTHFLDKAILNEHADRGNIQYFDHADQTLRIVAQKGFKTPFLKYFEVVKPFDTSACGRAIALGLPIIVGDIEQDIAFFPHLEVAREAGYRSVKSQPLFSSDKKLVGVLSLHCMKVRWEWDARANKEVIREVSHLLQQQHGDNF